MPKIVFVCTGNTCRSPMAEGIFRKLAQERGLCDTECTSCGLNTYEGLPVSENAVTAAAEYGVDIACHRARPITDELLREGDVFVCMSQWQKNMLEPYLSAQQKCIVLGDGIPDPYGGSAEVYRECAASICAALEDLVNRIAEEQQ